MHHKALEIDEALGYKEGKPNASQRSYMVIIDQLMCSAKHPRVPRRSSKHYLGSTGIPLTYSEGANPWLKALTKMLLMQDVVDAEQDETIRPFSDGG